MIFNKLFISLVKKACEMRPEIVSNELGKVAKIFSDITKEVDNTIENIVKNVFK